MSAELVSIVVPSFNHARYLLTTLDSLAEQTYSPIEVVVVDDASRDDSAHVLRAWEALPETQSRFARTVVVTRDENLGAHATLNEAVGLSTGRLVMAINSDDLYHPQRVAQIVDALAQDELAMAFSRVRYVDDDGTPVHGSESLRYEIEIDWILNNLPTVGFGLLHEQWAVSTGNLSFTRALFDRLGGFGDLAYCHDWDFALRATLLCEPTFVDACLYDYRLHGDNSFSSLGHVAGRETAAVIARFWASSARSVLNPRAPVPDNWPGAFDAYLAIMATRDVVATTRETLPRYVTRRGVPSA